MVQIGATYNDIANTLVTECADSSELRALQDFTNKAAVTLGELYDTYVNSCFERIRFALSHKHKLSRDDIQIIYTTYVCALLLVLLVMPLSLSVCLSLSCTIAPARTPDTT